MNRYHLWNVANGAAKLTAGPLRPHIFGPNTLVFRDAAGNHGINGSELANGEHEFILQPDLISALLNTPDTDKLPYLFLQTAHVMHNGAVDKRWGWRYLLTGTAGGSGAKDVNGTPLNLDSKGYFRTDKRKFTGPFATDAATIKIY